MKHRRFSALFLILALCLSLLSGTAAAEGGTIVAFAPLGDASAIVTPYKFSLVELEKLFPSELRVTLDIGRTENVPASWRCIENYDEALDVFHFVPVLDRPTAEGLALPEITVTFEGALQQSVMTVVPDSPRVDVPILGALTEDGYVYAAAALPSSYNAYERGLLPAIRNQNPYGTCWAHAAIGSVEADLIHDGAAGTSVDLSELHLAYFVYHDYADEKGCNEGDTVQLNASSFLVGGNDWQATNRMANLVGPAWESAVPYSLNTSYSPSASAGRNDGCSIQISGAYSINTADREAIKYNIMAHGGVDASYYDYDSYYSYAYNSYYYPEASGVNHSVMLVGWDDSFPKSNFAGDSKPEGNGAWLVRNSWGGSGYSHFSYFWISYYDKSLDEVAVAYDAVTTQYDHCYAYCGSPFWAYYTMDDGVMTTQTYNVSKGETITALGVQTKTAELDLTITVSCAGKTVTQTRHTTYPGYYLIPLNETIPVAAASTATVQITHSGSSEIIIPFETSATGGNADFNANCASGGMMITSSNYTFNTDADSLVRLFTDDGLSGGFVYGEPDFRLPAKTRTVGNNAFEGLKMSVVYVPDTCSSIGAQAFRNCTNLTQIRLPKNCTIDSTAFSGCSALSCIFAPAGGTTETWCQNNNIPFTAE